MPELLVNFEDRFQERFTLFGSLTGPLIENLTFRFVTKQDSMNLNMSNRYFTLWCADHHSPNVSSNRRAITLPTPTIDVSCFSPTVHFNGTPNVS